MCFVQKGHFVDVSKDHHDFEKNTAPHMSSREKNSRGWGGKKTVEERNSRKNICTYRFLLLLLVDSVQKKNYESSLVIHAYKMVTYLPIIFIISSKPISKYFQILLCRVLL